MWLFGSSARLVYPVGTMRVFSLPRGSDVGKGLCFTGLSSCPHDCVWLFSFLLPWRDFLGKLEVMNFILLCYILRFTTSLLPLSFCRCSLQLLAAPDFFWLCITLTMIPFQPFPGSWSQVTPGKGNWEGSAGCPWAELALAVLWVWYCALGRKILGTSEEWWLPDSAGSLGTVGNASPGHWQPFSTCCWWESTGRMTRRDGQEFARGGVGGVCCLCLFSQAHLGGCSQVGAFYLPSEMRPNEWMFPGCQCLPLLQEISGLLPLGTYLCPASEPCHLCSALAGLMLGIPWSPDFSQIFPRWWSISDGSFCTTRGDPVGESCTSCIELK